MKKHNYTILIFTLTTFLITGCIGRQRIYDIRMSPVSPTEETNNSVSETHLIFDIGDGGLLSSEPCGTSCFFGIEPGKTSQEDVSRILTQRNIINTCRAIDYYEKITSKQIGGWTCPNFSITFPKATGVVDSIGFEPTTPITLQDVIDIHGPPDIIVVLDTGLPEYPSVQASIYYYDLRIALPLTEEQKGTEYKIESNTPIYIVNYLDNQSLKNDLETFKEEIVRWKGYGNYP